MVGERFSTRKRRGGSGIVWGVLAIVLVVAMFKWGLPWFVDVLAGPSALKAPGVSSSEDIVPPQIPAISPLPEATNSATLKIEGFTEAKMEVSVRLNDTETSNTNSDDNGFFRAEVKLSPGSNKIQAVAKDGAGNTSQSVIKTINLDLKGVEITIDSPRDGSEVFGQSNQNVTFSGKVSKPDASVNINGNYVRLDSNGNFSSIVRLNQGDNNVSVKATDRAGNTIEKIVKIKLTY